MSHWTPRRRSLSARARLSEMQRFRSLRLSAALTETCETRNTNQETRKTTTACRFVPKPGRVLSSDEFMEQEPVAGDFRQSQWMRVFVKMDCYISNEKT